MAHVRQQVRDAVRQRLGTIAGLTVPDNIAAAITESAIPAAVVSTPSSEATNPDQDTTGAGGIKLWAITTIVTLIAEGEIGEDEIDVLAVQIESVLDDDLDGIARLTSPVGEERYELDRMTDEDGQLWLTFAEFEFIVHTATVMGDPETVI